MLNENVPARLPGLLDTPLARMFKAVPFVMAAFFCGFGFVASFEAGAQGVLYRVIYGTVGTTCIAGALRLLFK
jgi:hypothetical protein